VVYFVISVGGFSFFSYVFVGCFSSFFGFSAGIPSLLPTPFLFFFFLDLFFLGIYGLSFLRGWSSFFGLFSLSFFFESVQHWK